MPEAGTALHGVSTESGWHDLGGLDAFEAQAGKPVGLFMYYQGWGEAFPGALLQSVVDRGAVPMLTWEPWDHRRGIDQPDYRLRTIIDGAHDADIRRWAEAARDWGEPLLLRFAHEMNGDWYPWSERRNGNRAGEYVAAWRYVHGIFAEVGATNVAFVWTPNVDYPGATPLADLFPGDAYVDWVGLDGYNGGTALDWGGWGSFGGIFGPSLDALESIAPGKPVVIAETASAEQGGDKAAWINGFFDALEHREAIRAFVWFHHDKETNWRIDSSEDARQAFAERVADPRYR